MTMRGKDMKERKRSRGRRRCETRRRRRAKMMMRRRSGGETMRRMRETTNRRRDDTTRRRDDMTRRRDDMTRRRGGNNATPRHPDNSRTEQHNGYSVLTTTIEQSRLQLCSFF